MDKILIIVILYFFASCVNSDWQLPKEVCSVVVEIGGCNRDYCGVRLKDGAIAQMPRPVIGEQKCYRVGNSQLIKWNWWLL